MTRDNDIVPQRVSRISRDIEEFETFHREHGEFMDKIGDKVADLIRDCMTEYFGYAPRSHQLHAFFSVLYYRVNCRFSEEEDSDSDSDSE